MDEKTGYPRLLRRIQALMIDGLIVSILAIGALVLAPRVGLQGIHAAISATLVVFMLEPFLVSVTGGTLGHHLLGIRVTSKRSGKNINIFAAVVRFLAKIVLGWLSLVSIFVTKQHQAIHDSLVGSIVVLKHPEQMPAHEVLGERQVQQQEYIYPSKLRRIVMIVIYNILSYLIIGIVSVFFVSEPCLLSGKCSDFDNALFAGMSALWTVAFGISIVLCWKGYLFGCRRRLNSAIPPPVCGSDNS